MDIPSFKEDQISQVSALQLLQKLGYIYLSPDEALWGRGWRLAGVLLEDVLTWQLRQIKKCFIGHVFRLTFSLKALLFVYCDSLHRRQSAAWRSLGRE